jgi:hypothetical protein
MDCFAVGGLANGPLWHASMTFGPIILQKAPLKPVK